MPVSRSCPPTSAPLYHCCKGLPLEAGASTSSIWSSSRRLTISGPPSTSCLRLVAGARSGVPNLTRPPLEGPGASTRSDSSSSSSATTAGGSIDTSLSPVFTGHSLNSKSGSACCVAHASILTLAFSNLSPVMSPSILTRQSSVCGPRLTPSPSLADRHAGHPEVYP